MNYEFQKIFRNLEISSETDNLKNIFKDLTMRIQACRGSAISLCLAFVKEALHVKSGSSGIVL